VDDDEHRFAGIVLAENGRAAVDFDTLCARRQSIEGSIVEHVGEKRNRPQHVAIADAPPPRSIVGGADMGQGRRDRRQRRTRSLQPLGG